MINQITRETETEREIEGKRERKREREREGNRFFLFTIFTKSEMHFTTTYDTKTATTKYFCVLFILFFFLNFCLYTIFTIFTNSDFA